MQFEFFADVEKATSEEGKLLLQGVASTTDTDLQNEAISPAAIESMAKSAIGIPVVINSHNHEFTDEIGAITKAEAINGKLHIEAELDKEDPIAVRTFKKIQKNKKVGFSIGGKGKGRVIGKSRVIDEVLLKHIMVTSKPANPNTFAVAIAKALTEDVDIIQSEDTMTLEEMLKSEELQAHIAGELAKAKTEAEEIIAKAGATFSATTKSALKDIHAAGDDVVKGMVRDLLGDEADEVLAVEADAPEANDAPEGDQGPEVIDGDSDDNDANVADGIGVEKSLEDKLEDFKKAVITEIKEAVAQIATVEPKGSASVENPSPAAPVHNETLGDSLRRMLSGG